MSEHEGWAFLCRRCCHLMTEHRMGRLSKTTFWCRICACPVSHESAPSAPMTQRQWVIYDALKPEKRAEFGASVIRAHDEATATKETR